MCLELLRCIAKVTAEFINNTGETLELDDYSHYIKNICPDNGYIIKHPAVSPASAVMGTLNATVNDHEIVSERTEIYKCGRKKSYSKSFRGRISETCKRVSDAS